MRVTLEELLRLCTTSFDNEEEDFVYSKITSKKILVALRKIENNDDLDQANLKLRQEMK